MQPALLPLFPLEVVLMPGGHLPLHIFEERYKEMIGEALRDNSEFGIVLASRNGLASIGCTATIEGVLQRYDDGRLDIVTRGQRRFELQTVNEERSFLRGAVEFFDDDEPSLPAVDSHRDAAAQAYNALQQLWKNQPLEEAAYSDPRMSFRLVRAIRDLAFRQAILKLRNEAERMAHLAQYLPQLAAHIQKEEARQEQAKQDQLLREANGGSVSPNLNGKGWIN